MLFVVVVICNHFPGLLQWNYETILFTYAKYLAAIIRSPRMIIGMAGAPIVTQFASTLVHFIEIISSLTTELLHFCATNLA